MLEITTLGDLSIRLNGEAVMGLASRKAEALLVYLAVTRQVQPREFLAALLWEEEQVKALGNLRVVLSSLRKALKEYIDIHREKVSLSTDANIIVDVLELLDVAPIAGDQTAFSHLKGALNLYQGSFLLGFNLRNAPLFENWVTLERRHFRTVFDNKFRMLLDCLIDGGHWQDAVEWGENWVTRTRQGYTPETAFRALMKAYAGMGDLSGLSSAYQRCIQYLGDGLGIDPSEQTQQLYVQLLGGRIPKTNAAAVADATAVSPAVSTAQVVLNRWRDSSVEFLDLVGLSLLYISLKDLELGMEDTSLLIRSALHHGLDVRPWVREIDAPEKAMAALAECLASDGQPFTRIQIIDALKEIPGEPAKQVLVDLAMHDRSAEVRSEAALAALARGEGDALIGLLADELRENGNTAVMPPLVALVDESGNMPSLDFYPRLMVWMGVVRRRWGKHREVIGSVTLRSTIAAAIFSILYGSIRPFFTYLADFEEYQSTLDTMSITPLAWVLSGAIGSLLIGGVQGLATGFALGLADTLSTAQSRAKWRIFAGGVSGLVHTMMVMLFAAADLTAQIAGLGITIPVLIIHGLIYGAGLSFLYPPFGMMRSRRQQLMRAIWVTTVLLVTRVLQVFLVWGGKNTLDVFINEIVFVIFVTFGIALAFSKKELSSSELTPKQT